MSVVLSSNEAATAVEEIAERKVLGLTPDGWLRILMPLLIGLLALGGWEWAVRAKEIPSYILPGPIEIGRTLMTDWGTLSGSLLITLQITFAALTVAAVLGLALAVLFAQSRIIELSLFPYAVILQVTPIVAIAPLIFIWVDDIRIALLICAWIVAFFPILSNTILGLNSADTIWWICPAVRANRCRAAYLRLPTGCPISSGDAHRAGSADGASSRNSWRARWAGSGLAYRILEAGYQLKMRMFAPGAISVNGIASSCAQPISHLSLRHWHESAMKERK